MQRRTDDPRRRDIAAATAKEQRSPLRRRTHSDARNSLVPVPAIEYSGSRQERRRWASGRCWRPYRLPAVKRRMGRVAMSGVRITEWPHTRFPAERAGPGRVLLIGLVALLALLGACQQPA